MIKVKKTINEILASWGKANRQMPPRNEFLKREILGKSNISHSEIARPQRHLPWLSFASAGIALLVLFISPKFLTHYTTPPGIPISGPIKETLPESTQYAREPGLYKNIHKAEAFAPLSEADLSAPLDYKKPFARRMQSRINDSELYINDNREFLKTYYSASVRSRHIEELTQRIQVSVRGFGGRVDSASSSKHYGYVSFAIRRDKFDVFKNELKDLFGERFYSENIQTENLLPQKRSIENQQQSAQKTLDQLRIDRNKLKKRHLRIVESIKSEMDAVAVETANLQAEVTNDWVRRMEIANRIRELLKRNSELAAGLRNENSQYADNLYSYNSQIHNYESNLTDLAKQDRNVIDTAATVRGTISLSWISIWEIIDLYLPSYWLTILFLILAVFFYFIHRRKNRIITI
jgi:hypothetical protein